MKMRAAGVAAIAAAWALVLAGCTGGSSSGGSGDSTVNGETTGQITFQTWSLKNEKFTPYFEKLVKDFEAANPGTTVKWIDQPGDGYEDKLLQQAESGELPDVVNLSDSLAYTLAKAGKLQDLATVAPDAIKLYVAGGLEGYTFDGLDGTWAYPWYLGTDLSWWNMAQLKEAGISAPPSNNEDYLADAAIAAEATEGKVRLVSSLPDATTLQDAGVTLFKDGKFVFNTPEAAKILDQYVALYQTGAMPPDSLNDDYAGNTALFTQNKAAFATASPSFVTQLTDEAPNLIPDVKVTRRLIPNPPLFLQGLSLSTDTKNLELAKKFAEFATNDANQIAFVQLARGFLPGTIAANEQSDKLTEGVDDPLLAEAITLAAEQMKDAKPTSVLEYTDDMKKYTGQQIALALQGKQTTQEALDKSVDYANQNLAG
jgi:multiple sugar transport system substrate-binding protein